MADVHDLFLDLFTFILLIFVVFIVGNYIVDASPKRIVGLQQCGIKKCLDMACTKRHSYHFPEIWGSDFQFDEF